MTDTLTLTFSALADPTRRAILARLASGDAVVKDLALPFAMSSPAVSKHLRVLERAGLVERGREKQWRPRRLVAAPLAEADAWLQAYRPFWEERFDRMEALLHELKAAKRPKRRRFRNAARPALPDNEDRRLAMDKQTQPPELSLSRLFDAPRALVFRLWSDPEHVKRWWHPRDFTTPVFEMDFRVGGAYRYCIRSKGRDGWAHGVYRDIVVPERLVFTFQWESGDAARDIETLITLRFQAQGDKTLLGFHQTPFASVAERDSHAGGWGQVLDSLEQFLVAQGRAS